MLVSAKQYPSEQLTARSRGTRLAYLCAAGLVVAVHLAWGAWQL